MRISTKSLKIAGLFLLCALSWGTLQASADTIFAPEYLRVRRITDKTDPVEIADTHLGIPYRDDGTLDGNGSFTTFAKPETVFPSPGLNCSGLVLSASRFLLNRNFKLSEATRDRQGNSGPDSPLGADWDFGLDLMLNLTEGLPRKVLMPDKKEYSLEKADGMELRGFDLDDGSAWQEVLARMRPGRAYFGSISKPTRRPGYRLVHYHVVLMLPDGRDHVWLYHATRRSNVHKMDLKTKQGMARFQSQFKNSRNEPKKILIVEALLPGAKETQPTVADVGAPPSSPPPSDRGDQATPSGRVFEMLDETGTAEDEPESEAPPSTGVAQPEPDVPRGAQAKARSAVPPGDESDSPDLVVNHVSGRVFKPLPDMVTQIPRFADESKTAIKLSYRNRSDRPRDLEITARGPDGEFKYRGKLPASGTDTTVIYPQDFGKASTGVLTQGKYLVQIKVDGIDWCGDIFEVDLPREAQPKIISFQVPSTVPAGKPFTVKVVAENTGAESDYGGITVSSPDPGGLKLISAKPGKIYPGGSTVLAVTTDRIKTKVPMAERWIELWGEKKQYDMELKVQAGAPGTYHLYVRCALRSVKVKSSVVLMDPKSSDAVDQQGFPVYVHVINVR